MVNTLIPWVLVGVFLWLWYFVGNIDFLAKDGGGLRDAYWIFTVIAAAMLAGGK